MFAFFIFLAIFLTIYAISLILRTLLASGRCLGSFSRSVKTNYCVEAEIDPGKESGSFNKMAFNV